MGIALCNASSSRRNCLSEEDAYLALIIPGLLKDDLTGMLQNANPTFLANTLTATLTFRDPLANRVFPKPVVCVKLRLQNAKTTELKPSVDVPTPSTTVVWLHAFEKYSPDQWSNIVVGQGLGGL